VASILSLYPKRKAEEECDDQAKAEVNLVAL
jgi:hypothetical protein